MICEIKFKDSVMIERCHRGYLYKAKHFQLLKLLAMIFSKLIIILRLEQSSSINFTSQLHLRNFQAFKNLRLNRNLCLRLS